MAKTRIEIARDLLREAGFYWHDDNEDKTRPLDPEDFDPVVDKIFKANAVELEKLHAEIKESQRAIILGLSQTLVPNQSLLPEPGYTIAQINPKASRIDSTPEDQYLISGQSDTGENFQYYFTPLFEHSFPKCGLHAILTDHLAVKVDNNLPEIVEAIAGEQAVQVIWLGLDIERVNDNDVISFFLGDKIVDEFDKNHFVFQNAKWLLDGDPGKELSVKIGIEHFGDIPGKSKNSELMDMIDIPNSYEKQIFSRFRNSFIHVALPENIKAVKKLLPTGFDASRFTAKIEGNNPLYWIKLELPLAVSDRFLINNTLYPNCLPMVNRRMIDQYVVKRNYDRMLLPMPTTDLFLDVCKVQDRKNDEGNGYQRVDFLHPDSLPGTYMLRSGSRVRRLNREDASRRIYRLLDVIEEEYSTFKEEGVNRLKQDFDVIEKAINRVKEQMPHIFREEEKKSSYFGIANFKPGVSRLYYSYWETQGELIRHLGNKVGLVVSSPDINIVNSKSIIAIQKGKGAMTAEDYINQTRIALLSKGRIMTRGDMALYCKSRFGDLLKVEKIGRELMMLEGGKLGRGILLRVKMSNIFSKQEAEFIRLELQNDLNARSAFFTQIKVELNYDAG